MQPHPVADVGWANGMDQGITGFFLQGFALHGAYGQPKGGVLADQGSIGPLADSEQCFSHAWDIRALLARAIYCYIFSETEREKV